MTKKYPVERNGQISRTNWWGILLWYRAITTKALSGFKESRNLSPVTTTDQAEMIATVLYSYDELNNGKQKISDKDVYNYVMSWKPHWKQEKNYEVCDAIHNLAMLSLISVTHSNLLLDTSLF